MLKQPSQLLTKLYHNESLIETNKVYRGIISKETCNLFYFCLIDKKCRFYNIKCQFFILKQFQNILLKFLAIVPSLKFVGVYQRLTVI